MEGSEEGQKGDDVVETIDPEKLSAHKRHQHRTRLAIVLLVVVLLPTIVFAAYPRVNMNIRVWYSEGVLGVVNVDVAVRNVGTLEVSITEIELTVLNASGVELGKKVYTGIQLRPRAEYSGDNIHLGPGDLVNETLWSTFKIIFKMTYTARGESNTVGEEYTTIEPDMSILFEKNVQDWGF